MATSTTKKGTVTAFDGHRGIADVALEGGSTTEVPAGAFLSGRPARLPAKGDAVEVRLRPGTEGKDVAVLARLLRQ